MGNEIDASPDPFHLRHPRIWPDAQVCGSNPHRLSSTLTQTGPDGICIGHRPSGARASGDSWLTRTCTPHTLLCPRRLAQHVTHGRRSSRWPSSNDCHFFEHLLFDRHFSLLFLIRSITSDIYIFLAAGVQRAIGQSHHLEAIPSSDTAHSCRDRIAFIPHA